MPDVVQRPATQASVEAPARASQVPAWSEVTRLGGAMFRVRLAGSFGHGWLATLCRGLAAQQVNIERAHAVRARNRSWIAEFTARALDGAAQPESLPYLELAESLVAYDGQPLSIDRFEVESCYDRTLKLHIEARDALGLLGTLLEKLAALGLYPTEMHIETHAQRASDTLWLGTADGNAPNDLLRAALERSLKHALGPHPAR